MGKNIRINNSELCSCGSGKSIKSVVVKINDIE